MILTGAFRGWRPPRPRRRPRPVAGGGDRRRRWFAGATSSAGASGSACTLKICKNSTSKITATRALVHLTYCVENRTSKINGKNKPPPSCVKYRYRCGEGRAQTANPVWPRMGVMGHWQVQEGGAPQESTEIITIRGRLGRVPAAFGPLPSHPFAYNFLTTEAISMKFKIGVRT